MEKVSKIGPIFNPEMGEFHILDHYCHTYVANISLGAEITKSIRFPIFVFFLSPKNSNFQKSRFIGSNFQISSKNFIYRKL